MEKKIFIDKNDNVFDYANYQAEVDLAVELAALLKNERNGAQGITQYEEKEINKIFESIKKESHIEFSPEQEEAIKMAFTEPIVIITGGPGTGKTTIVHAILKMYLKLNKDNSTLAEAIALLAPTGRAAKRLKESTNMPASTIHKFLGYQGENYFQYSKTNRTNARLIIVDEASMMDLPLASRLITSMHNSARLIIVGDVDQLPSVGPGQVLKDLIDSKEIKTIRLNKIHRQAADSSIIKLAHNINEGILPENLLDKLSDRNFIATSNEALPSMLTGTVILPNAPVASIVFASAIISRCLFSSCICSLLSLKPIVSADMRPPRMRLSMSRPTLSIELFPVFNFPSKAIFLTFIMAKRVSLLSVYTM